MTIAALIPVLGRPDRVNPLADSFHEATPRGRLFFLCSPDDFDEIDAVVEAGEHPHIVTWKPGCGDYSRKTNWGFRRAVSMGFEWMLLGADDLAFQAGWLEAALAVHVETGACVVGTNDGHNPKVLAGQHATHPLVHRDYLECGTVDEGRKILHEEYDHQWVDNEFVETAQSRGTYAHAHEARVEHLHPIWGHGEMDATYTKAMKHGARDQALYLARRHLWT